MNKTIRHIVLLTPGFAADENDSTTIPALQLYLKALKKELPDLKITIITFQFPYKTEGYKWNGCGVLPLNGQNKMLKRTFVWYKAQMVLKQLHKKSPIDILHSFWLGECAFIGDRFARKNQIKHIITLMGQDVLKPNAFSKLVPINSNNTVAVSKFQQSVFFDNYGFKSRVIEFGVNPDDFVYPTNKTIDFIGVGWLSSLKNYELFVDIVFELNKTNPLKAVLLGDGVQKKQLINRIALLGLEKVISLKGLVNYDEALALISQSKILLHPSRFESFGLVFAEALESRTMIVSKDVGCAFATKNWLKANTKEEMIKACSQLLATEFDETEKNPFTIKSTVKAYIELYHE